jgi:hypothetical protein
MVMSIGRSADDSHMRRALVLAFAVFAASCGHGPQGAADQAADVSLLHVSVTMPDGSRKDVGPEWYRPSTGEYDIRASLIGPGSHRILLGDEFARQSEAAGLMVATGSPRFIRRIGYPTLFDSPGVALYRQYLQHVPQTADYRVRASHADDGRLVLDFAVVIPSDSGVTSPPVHFRVMVDAPVSMAQARAHGAFALPDGRPDLTVNEGPPGSPSHLSLHPWWLGTAWEDDTARTVIEVSSTRPATPDTGSFEAPPGGSYQVAYRLRSTPADAGLEPAGVPSIPGVGNIPKGEVYVTSFQPDAELPFEGGGSETPITVGGEQATLILPGPGMTPNSFWVKTSDALIEIQLWYEMATPARMQEVAEQLRPVA